ncbi:MAG TPA: T9SS type A sorting domain-containing protein, partial [Flavipsychrobacter sp.]|nr:T9SS type A sorting domain-containing protein [Flavipsychrobacter sp.]
WCPGISTFHDYYLFFLDTSGNIQWSKSYGGTDADAVRNAFWDERDSTIVMIGITSSTNHMVSQSYAGVTSVWLIKTDVNGNLLWETTLGDTLQDNVNADVMPADEGYFVGGTLEDILQMHYGFGDILTYCIDTNGAIIRQGIIGGSGGDVCAAVVPFQSSYAVIGRSSTFLFAEGINENSNHTQNNQSDVTLSSLYDYPLKIKDVSSGAKLKVYPNPAKDIVKVVLPNNSEGILVITDASGRLILQQAVKNKTELDIVTKDWAKGIYSLKWGATNGRNFTAKLTIN